VVPSLISGDHRAQLGLGLSHGAVIGDVPARGIPVFRAPNSNDRSRVLSLDAAALISDRWQIGAGTSWIDRRIRQGPLNESSAGLGDLRISAAYEAWPEYRYTRWKPRGYVFALAQLPTAPSGYESLDGETPLQSDARGLGTPQLGVGALLLKRWSVWDAYALPEAHTAFARSFGSTTRIGTSWGGSLALGLGYQPRLGWPTQSVAWRLGLRVQPLFRSGRLTEVPGNRDQSAPQLAWNTALEAACLLSERWSAVAAYVDQTLLGPATNTTLSRIFTLSLQKRWER
jgi:hypothetical protein